MFTVARGGVNYRVKDNRAHAPGVVTIRTTPMQDTQVIALIARLDAELTERYPGVDHGQFTLRPSQVTAGRGVFLIAWAGDAAVGCGALRKIDHVTGEIKRMYVLPAARQSGVARMLVAELERRARELGIHRLVLHTGWRQPEAIGLYRSCGFSPASCYGPYTSADTGICMAKAIVTRPAWVPGAHRELRSPVDITGNDGTRHDAGTATVP